MRKKARLIGIRDTVIHGQTVPVRVFSSPFEPTFDFETTSSRACAASATELQQIKREYAAFVKARRLWLTSEYEDPLFPDTDHLIIDDDGNDDDLFVDPSLYPTTVERLERPTRTGNQQIRLDYYGRTHV